MIIFNPIRAIRVAKQEVEWFRIPRRPLAQGSRDSLWSKKERHYKFCHRCPDRTIGYRVSLHSVT